MLPWLDLGVYPWLRLGNTALLLSHPVLWYRIHAVGINGVSAETQILHFLTFFSRYLLCYPAEVDISLVGLGKAWLICASIMTVAYLLYMQRGSFTLKWADAMLSATSLVLSFSVIMTSFPIMVVYHIISSSQGGYVHGGYTMLLDFLIGEASWIMSQLIAVGAMIPQLVMLYRGSASGNLVSCAESTIKTGTRRVAGVDVWMWAYVASIAAFRSFHLIDWIRGYRSDGPIQTAIVHIGALLQLAIIYGFILVIVLKNRKTTHALPLSVSEPVGNAEKPSPDFPNDGQRV